MNNTTHPITTSLINWFSKAKRNLPWRETSDPYKIWLSEIILQQTRVEQGKPYYLSFVESFPDIRALADAPEDTVMRTWQGLGYYSRARNLHATAKFVTYELDGVFPSTYEDIKKLKGVGPYTAAAIASIVFGEAVPVIDGNVYRFISRLFGVYDDILKNSSRAVFEQILNPMISHSQPGDFNQAMMEYGATVCKPSPDCAHCLFTKECFAFNNKKQSELPVKIKKLKIKHRFLHYLILSSEKYVLMKKRTESIWQGLYEFLLIETTAEEETLKLKTDLNAVKEWKEVYSLTHLLTHQKLNIRFYTSPQMSDQQLKQFAKELDLELIERKEVLNLPKSKPIVNFLQQTVF